MAGISPLEEMELSYLSQVAQGGLVEVLQTNSPPITRKDALDAADALLDRLVDLLKEEPLVSPASVPDEAVRALVQRALFPRRDPTPFASIAREELDSVRSLIRELRSASESRDRQIRECLDFLRRVVERRVMMKLPKRAAESPPSEE